MIWIKGAGFRRDEYTLTEVEQRIRAVEEKLPRRLYDPRLVIGIVVAAFLVAITTTVWLVFA